LQAVNNGDYTGFYDAPDYQAALGQGLEAVDRQAAARGLLGSGGTDADRIRFGSDLASQQLGAYRGSLMGIANLGQNSASNLGQLGTSYTQMQTGQNSNAGAARASGYGAWGNALMGVGNAAGNYFGGRG
jgi:hypothetical protein